MDIVLSLVAMLPVFTGVERPLSPRKAGVLKEMVLFLLRTDSAMLGIVTREM
jgi:hypothetical protein